MARRKVRGGGPTRDEEPAAEWVDIIRLKPWAKNPRKNDGEPVDKVAASIKELGWGAPIVARRNGEIIAGHTRWKAAQQLGLTRVPVRFVDLDDDKARKLAIADNRLGELAQWNMPDLYAMLADMPGDDVALVGFSTSEVDNIMAQSIAETENMPPSSAEEEWSKGMPEFKADESPVYKTIQVHFKDEASVLDFAKRLEATLTGKTKYIWHPHEPPITEPTVVKGSASVPPVVDGVLP